MALGLFICALAYLLGSVPFGLVLTRLAGLGDIRNIGSGNIGATNVLRTGRRDLALATVVLDAGKGGLALLIAWWLSGDYRIGLAAGLCAFLGHLFPIFLGFKGGKGVATGLGLMLAANFWLGLIACGTWLIFAAVFRFSSLAALAAFSLGSVLFVALEIWLKAPWLAHFDWFGPWLLVLGVLVFVKHHENIRRLIVGTETKISFKS